MKAIFASILLTLAGLLLSGCESDVPPAPALFDLGVPTLGICPGVQIMAQQLGGKVEHSAQREYGSGVLHVLAPSPLFRGLPGILDIWISHGDKITKLPRGFRAIGKSDN